MLHFHRYKKAYGSLTVLQIDDLKLPAGTYWLKGSNGTGKTTVLRSIAGLLPFNGDIEVSGISLRKQRRLFTKHVSFSEAEPVYPSFLTGDELVEFYLSTKGGTKTQVMEIADHLDISPFLANKTGTYSSGMLKKLSLVLALLGKPKLVLLDEPFITLDTVALSALQTIIAEKSKEGISFLVSSHQDLALDIPFEILSIQQKTIIK